jgi:hypothetical protein
MNLRTAAQQALEALVWEAGSEPTMYAAQTAAAIDALRAAFAAEPEPVERAWLEAAVAWEVCASIHEKWAKGKDAVYTTRHADFVKHADDARAKAIAAPPQRQPLTDEHIYRIFEESAGYGQDDFVAFARAVERAHGIGDTP